MDFVAASVIRLTAKKDAGDFVKFFQNFSGKLFSHHVPVGKVRSEISDKKFMNVAYGTFNKH
jgi:hypothetical protein